MQLRVLRSREIWRPIKLVDPVDGGGVEHMLGDIRVRYPITRDDMKRLATAGDAILDEVAALVTGWRGAAFEDGDGQQHPFTRETLLAVLRVPALNSAVQQVLLDVANGRAASKNSGPGSGGSPA